MIVNCAHTSKAIGASFDPKWQPISKNTKAPYKQVTTTGKCILNQRKKFYLWKLKKQLKRAKWYVHKNISK